MTTEREQLEAEIAGQGEAVAWVIVVPGTTFKSVGFSVRLQDLPVGTELYAAPSASADSVSVPVELMRRLTKRVMLRSQEDAHADACEELRALLARQGVKS